MKYEWRKKDKNIYLPKTKPEIIEVEDFKYFTLCGEGNPNSEEFKIAIEALYSISYTLKMLPKKGIVPNGYYDYTVFPLEGIWDLKEEARGLDILDKDSLIYKIMIRQPDFVDNNLFKEVLEMVKSKKSNPLLDYVKFETIKDGLCVQMMHIGTYDNEPKTFKIMENFCEENNLTRISKVHREIYISDFRRTAPEKLKTVLRFKVSRD